MFETAGKMFFQALRDAVVTRLGRDHPCLSVVDRAIDTGGADATLAVQDALNALGADLVALLMADAHSAVRQNPAAILEGWQPRGIKR
ncbi:hypothetical protein QN224_29000 [Sinorhizobium sp. 8-89]|uniref:hypothetical protein n=1 Tax=Sinorhizobium sp. 7-81 TaxID=3049087 RepID=UPI0024C38534|nr:hypothetical protein [Sinorhizobium sp. 7-81]MDK1389432.1 hypothetical protein [Sinorhizobium sp. 7-81]